MNIVEKLTENQAVQSLAYPIEVKAYADGVQVKPSSATITVKDSGGSELVPGAAMAVNVTTGTMTYSLASAHTAELDEDALLEVTYVVSSVSYKAIFFFDVVISAFKCNVTDDDLKAYAPLLATEIWPGTTNYSGQIAEAFTVIKRLLKDKGKRPSMLIDGGQLRELIIVKTFEMLCFDFSKAPDDIWWARADKYAKLFGSRFSTLSIKYDADESGTVEGTETQTLGQVTFER